MMEKLQIDYERIKQVLPPIEFFKEHRRSIGAGIAALALLFLYPILLIPAFGIALPLYAGWLTLRSLLADRRIAAERQGIQRIVELYFRQAIADANPITLPVRENDDLVERSARVVEFDERRIELFDPIKLRNYSIAWDDIDLHVLYFNITGLEEFAGDKRTIMDKIDEMYLFIKKFSMEISKRCLAIVESALGLVNRRFQK
jgi:hypothetical protein